MTTYEPRGPWSKIHTDLSSLGSIHISNVHILANLEPFRWGSPDFVQKAVTAMHNVHGATAGDIMRILNQIKRKNPVETSVQTLARKRRTPILFFILPLPGLIALLMFSYLPMVGLYIVFERYTYQGGLFGSEFVGLKNFEFFFRNMSNALRATRNTLVINCFSILFGIAVNVALAIAVNEIRSVRFRKVTQSIMLFPHFISS